MINRAIRGHPTPRNTACVNDKLIRDLTRFYQRGRISLAITSNDLAPIRTHGLRQTLNATIVSHATLVLSVFTTQTQDDRNGLRIRLTRLRCQLPQLNKRNGSLSQLNNNVNAHNPNRDGLRDSQHRVHHQVATLRQRLGAIRRQQRQVRLHHRGGQTLAMTLINCAGTNGSALVGTLASTNILITSRLFTALSPATQQLILPSNHRIVLISAIKLIRQLPRRLISTFHSALTRTT